MSGQERSYHFRNLVFEGGGVKGFAYVGAMEVLDQRQILSNIRRVGGTSAGAINAVLVALGYSPDEMRRAMENHDFTLFLDDHFGVIRDSFRLLTRFGWHRGDYFRKWIGEFVEAKTGDPEATFKDLAERGEFKDLFLYGTNLSTRFSRIFSAGHTPDTPVAEAARISMSIPLLFAAIRDKGEVLVDGGMLNNYPVKLFDQLRYVESPDCARLADYYQKENQRRTRIEHLQIYNKETLGFRLDSKRELPVFIQGAAPEIDAIDGFGSYAKALIATMFNIQENAHLHGDDWQRTVYINTLGVGTTDFDLSDEKKKALVQSGRKHTEAYFQWFDRWEDGEDPPVSHPGVRIEETLAAPGS